MNKLLYPAAILALLICAHTLLAQNLKTDSLTNWGKTGWELPSDMVSDTDGNFYLTGSFSGNMIIGNQELKSNGKRDIFLAKFNPENQLLWAKNLGGINDDNAYSLLFTGNKLYLTGSFRKEISFNNGSIQLTGKGISDVFIARLEPDGSLTWARAFSSDAPAQKAFLQPDNSGNIWIAGSYTRPVEAAGIKISKGDNKGIYFASFSPDGNLEKSNYFNSLGNISLNGFLINQKGYFCFAGSFTETLEIGGQSLLSKGKTDGFIAVLNSEGIPLWMKNPGGIFDDQIKCLGQDAEGNIYIAGDFKYRIFVDKEYTAPQNTDILLIKYTPGGETVWVRQFGEKSRSYNTITSIEVAADGRFFVGGTFVGLLQESPGIKSLGNNKNAFLAKYNSNGQREWAIGTQSPGENKLWMKFSPASGSLFVSGYFNKGFKLGDFELNNKESKDVFFGRLVDCDLAPKINLGPDTTVCQGIEIYAKGSFRDYFWSNGQTTQSVKPALPGKYTVLATDRFGCVSEDSINLNLLPAPEFDLGTELAICQGQNKILEGPQGFAAYQWDNGTGHPQRMLAQTGKYWLKVTDSLGCTSTDTLVLTVNPLPEFDLGPDRIVSANETLELEPLLPSGNYKFLWGNGSTEKKLRLQGNSFTRDANIILTVTDQNLCSYTSMVKVNSQNSPGDQVEQIPDNFKIFPNPSQGKFYISASPAETINQIEVYDMRGNLVKRIETVNIWPVEIDLNGTSKGTYLLKIINLKLTRDYKIVLN